MKKLLVAIVILLAFAGSSFAGSLTLTSPNGGETLNLGATVPITWTVVGLSSKTVKLQLFEGDTLLGEIATGIPATRGQYGWKVGELLGGQPPRVGDTFRIRIKVQGSDNTDRSDASFTVQFASLGGGQLQHTGKGTNDYRSELKKVDSSSAKLTKTTASTMTKIEKKPLTLSVGNPRAGDRWEEGETRLITWTTPAKGVYSIELYDREGRTKVSEVASRQLPMTQDGDYQYRWEIPLDAVSVGGDYRVKVSMGEASAMSERFRIDNRLKTETTTIRVPATLRPDVRFANTNESGFTIQTVEGLPSPDEMIVGANNGWFGDDGYEYHVYRTHVFFDVSGLAGKGLLTAARLRYGHPRQSQGNVSSASANGRPPCDPEPIAFTLDAVWDGTEGGLFAIPSSEADPGKLVPTIARWMARPYENHGLQVISSLERMPLPWGHTTKCVAYYGDVHLELEFLGEAH